MHCHVFNKQENNQGKKGWCLNDIALEHRKSVKTFFAKIGIFIGFGKITSGDTFISRL